MAAPTGARKSRSCRVAERCGVECEAASAPSPSAWRPVGLRCGAVSEAGRAVRGGAGRGSYRGAAGGVYWLTGGRKGRRDPRPSPSCPQAAAYGRCVQASTAPGGRLTKDLCAQEFEALRRCFAAAVSGRRPRRGGGHPGFGVGRRQVLRTRHTRPPASATPAVSIAGRGTAPSPCYCGALEPYLGLSPRRGNAKRDPTCVLRVGGYSQAPGLPLLDCAFLRG